MEKVDNIKYYKLLKEEGENDIFVRVIDDINLEYLNSELEWIPNQEWYVAMFYDGDIDYKEVKSDDIDKYIMEHLNSKKMIR